MEKKMRKSDFKIVDKDGKVIESQEFRDYDQLADYMLGIADKWYEGVYDPEQNISISSYNEEGELIYQDSVSFGASEDVELELEQPELNIPNLSDFGYEVEGI